MISNFNIILNLSTFKLTILIIFKKKELIKFDKLFKN